MARLLASAHAIRDALRRLLAVALLLGPPSAEAGFAIVDDAGHQTLLSGGRLKMRPAGAGGVAMVLDVRRARMWVADAGRRVVWEGTVEQYCQEMRGAMARVRDEMDTRMAEQLKDMPPAQREQMQQMLRPMGRAGAPAGPPPAVTIERTGDTEEIARFPTRKYRVFSNGRPHEELWLTTDAPLLRELDAGAAPDTFGRMSACMTGMAGSEQPEATPEFRKLYAEGWPLKVVYFGDDGTVASTVLKVEPRDIPETEFTPPTGYRAAPLTEVFATPGR
jgi:hypothetical protein